MTHQDTLAEYAQAKEKALGVGGAGKLAGCRKTSCR